MPGATKNSSSAPACLGWHFFADRLSQENKHMNRMIGEEPTSKPRNVDTTFISAKPSRARAHAPHGYLIDTSRSTNSE